MQKFRIVLVIAAVALLCSVARAENAVIDKVMKEQDGRIPREAMVKAFEYYQTHSDAVKNKAFVTIVDFNRPSSEKRMHVIDMNTGEVTDLLVAHGKNSGSLYASSFSNENGTNKSSQGIYLSAEEYVGKHGLSMRLDGMEPTNSNVRKRDIVMHGATYVSPEFLKKNGRLGRSEGCLALEQPLITAMVKKLQGGSVILVYRGTGPEAGKDTEPKAK